MADSHLKLQELKTAVLSLFDRAYQEIEELLSGTEFAVTSQGDGWERRLEAIVHSLQRLRGFVTQDLEGVRPEQREPLGKASEMYLSIGERTARMAESLIGVLQEYKAFFEIPGNNLVVVGESTTAGDIAWAQSRLRSLCDDQDWCGVFKLLPLLLSGNVNPLIWNG